MSEWLDEPDREEFEYSGYKCLILRHPEYLHLCGYAEVTKKHIYYHADKGHLPYKDLFSVRVHGDITFSDEGDGEYLPKGSWWIGFDCAHALDLSPRMVEMQKQFFDDRKILTALQSYRNFQYVREQIQRLVIQLITLDFIDWQFKWVWPLLLPRKTARYLWSKKAV
jgi:hypothetical protein